MAAFGKEIFGRVFTHMDVAGLLGGAASFILDIFVVDQFEIKFQSGPLPAYL
jgi:hypothetical protein